MPYFNDAETWHLSDKSVICMLREGFNFMEFCSNLLWQHGENESAIGNITDHGDIRFIK